MPIFTALGVKGVAILVLLLALGGWAAYKTYQVSSAQAEAVAAKAERDEAATARDEALKVNTANQLAISQLQKEKADIQVALTNLDADRKKNQKVINDLSAVIRTMATDPANKVQLSPVLQATVDTIQKQRTAREALP
jgi:hypothetical protein